MNIHDVSNSSDLSPQDLKLYFDWPPPPVKPKKKNKTSLYIAGFLLLLLIFTLVHLSIKVMLLTTLITIGGIIAGCYGLKKYKQAHTSLPPVPTDAEYETWVKSWSTSIRQYGMQRLGLEAQDVLTRPLYVRSLVWPNSYEAKQYYQYHGCPTLIKKGMDGRPHASVNRFTFFYPTQHFIGVFIGDVNALGTMRYEATRTYFYDDIVGVETSAFNLNNDSTTYTMQHFELRISSSQSVGATTYVHDLDVDETINALRTLLRDKKYGIHNAAYNTFNY